MHVRDMHLALNLMTLDERRTPKEHLNCLCHKNIYTNLRTALGSCFVKVTPTSRVTRHACNMNVPVPNYRTEKGRKAFAYHGPYVWNALSDDVQNTPNFNAFIHKTAPNRTAEMDNHPT